MNQPYSLQPIGNGRQSVAEGSEHVRSGLREADIETLVDGVAHPLARVKRRIMMMLHSPTFQGFDAGPGIVMLPENQFAVSVIDASVRR